MLLFNYRTVHNGVRTDLSIDVPLLVEEAFVQDNDFVIFQPRNNLITDVLALKSILSNAKLT